MLSGVMAASFTRLHSVDLLMNCFFAGYAREAVSHECVFVFMV